MLNAAFLYNKVNQSKYIIDYVIVNHLQVRDIFIITCAESNTHEVKRPNWNFT